MGVAAGGGGAGSLGTVGALEAPGEVEVGVPAELEAGGAGPAPIYPSEFW